MLVHDLIWRGDEFDTAIIDGTRKVTYRGLSLLVSISRARLYEMGVRTRDRVAIYSRNSADYIVAYMAIVSLGAIVVPVNFQLSMRETAFILKNAGAKLILSDHELDLAAAMNQADYHEAGQTLLSEIMKPSDWASAPPLPASFGPDEPAAIIYTSGTTGSPKGAVLSHRNLLMNAIDLQQVVRLTRRDNVLCVLPMYHCFAWTCAVMNELYAGATITVLDSFTPKKTIDLVKEHQITDIVMVPSICSLLAKLAAPSDMASLRFVMLGGTTLPIPVGEAFMTKFGIPIVEGYGLSEASPVVTMTPPDAPKLGSVGPAIPDVNIRIVDDVGRDVAKGEAGEILVQGPNVMHGYWRDSESTAKALEGGWLHTGDVARMDGDGYLYIVDRLKDMIISMGENIYPREIEELIYAYPGIEEAAVIAIDDQLRGQAGCCYYSVQKTYQVNQKELKKYLQQNLALFKIPRELIEIEDMPKTPTGKIQKLALKEHYLASKRGTKKGLWRGTA